MRLKSRGVACSAPQLWRALVVILVLVISVLQVVHITLLSRLEARRSRDDRRSPRSAMTEWSAGDKYGVTEMSEDRARMLRLLEESTVLDISGEFSLVSNFQPASPPPTQAPLPAQTGATPPKQLLQQAAQLTTLGATQSGLSSASNEHSRGGIGTALTRDVTLVTQSSIGPLSSLDPLASRWAGPVSIAVFATKRREIPDLIETILHLRACYRSVRHNVSFHLVYPLHSKTSSSSGPHQASPSLALAECSTLPRRIRELQQSVINYGHQVAYPVNLLRNFARRNARSQYVFVVDVDLQVNEGLHDAFLSFAKENALFSRVDHQEAFVVPAFEAAEDVRSPRTKAELLELFEQGAARPFYAELCHKCHKHTDYEAWTKAPYAADSKLQVLYQVSWKDPWEPFYIAHYSVPLFDERFRQYGFNRISQACEMHVAGYSFAVLNNAFVVHRGLKRSGDFHKEKEKDLGKNRLNFRQFKTELKEKYKESPRRCY